MQPFIPEQRARRGESSPEDIRGLAERILDLPVSKGLYFGDPLFPREDSCWIVKKFPADEGETKHFYQLRLVSPTGEIFAFGISEKQLILRGDDGNTYPLTTEDLRRLKHAVTTTSP